MEEQRILTAAEAAEVKMTKNITLNDVMYSVENASRNGRGSLTYDVRYDVFEEGVIEKLKELGYNVTFNDYKTSAYIGITWESDEQRIKRIKSNIPRALRP